ncbi:ras GEF [Anaeromyces robustus]|uniref:Ras GEF n=1 Tax=Anaeromyces robustus TaxID=1754192 RepID=A0A1Y1XDM9_9FUNG|nr:ras GEF [Anaeromyces robustus]|eukprot:ORX83849.1 ras GEF [Anaeromyces robustus]
MSTVNVNEINKNNNKPEASKEAYKTYIMNVEKNFFSYNCNTVYLIENKDDDGQSSSRSSSRRSSIMIAPSSRKTTVRLDSQTFPKTIEVAESPENDTLSVNSDKSTKRGSKLFGLFLNGHRKNGSDSSSIICASPSQSANISRQQSGVNDFENNESLNLNKSADTTGNVPLGEELFRQASNCLEKNGSKNNMLKRTISDLGSSLILKESRDEMSSELDCKESKFDIPPPISVNFAPEVDPIVDNLKSFISAPPLSSSVPSNNILKSNEEEDGVAELHTPAPPKARGRRRACTVSIGTSGHLVTSTLKSSKVNPRRPISGLFDVNINDINDINKVSINIILPDKTILNQKFNLDSTLDYVCDSICISNKLDLNNHSLILTEKPDYNLEFDRTLGYYKDLKIPINKMTIVQQSSGKHYSTMTICENDVDVMLFQMSKEGLQVMAGTVPKLIEHLTDNSENNSDFLDTLLLTYRSFITPVELFNELVARFNCLPPDNPTEDDLLYYDKMKLPVQQRVIKTLRWWVHYHWQDFSFSYQLSENLNNFVKQLKEYSEENKTDVFKEDMDDIQDIIDRELKSYEKKWDHYKTLHAQKSKNLMDSVLTKFDEETIAKQLCLHDFELFKNIHPIEYLNAIWKAKKSDDEENDEDNTPNLDFFISRFDKESYWVATEICVIPELKKRIQMLKKWILTANECIKNNNFFSFFSIVAGLNLTPVSRLKKTWDGLSEKYTKMWNELEKICDPSRNMKAYRDILAKSNPPIVPFLPIYLKDLTFMNDGNDAKVNGMINFDKLRMMAKRVKDISKLVDYSYKNIQSNNTLENYISHPMVKGLKELKQLSLNIEPKDKK